MTQTVQTPDGTIHNFPDEATPEMISQALGLTKPAATPAQEDRASFTSRAMQGAVDPLMGIAQAVPHIMQSLTSSNGVSFNKNPENPISRLFGQSAQTIDRAIQSNESGYQDARNATGQSGLDAARLLGNVVSPINSIGAEATLAATPNIASPLGRFAAETGGQMAGGAGIAMTNAVSDPNQNYGQEKLKQAELGAGFGGAGKLLGDFAGGIINPQISTDAKNLLKQGVNLTTGQIKGGTTKRIEDALVSVPLVGDVIKGAQNRSIDSLNRVAINRSLSPIGESLPKKVSTGREAITYAEDKLSDSYQKLIPKLSGRIDKEFADDMDNLDSMVDADFVMSDAAKSKYKNIMNTIVRNRFSNNGSVFGQGIKDIESNLGDLSNKFGTSLDPSDKQLSSVLLESQDALRRMLSRANPDHADELAKINKGWANFKRVQKAAASTGTDQGIFTPAQLQNAIKASDKSKDKGRFARGDALMQDLSEPAKATLPSSVNDSGTPLRSIVGLGALGGAAHFSPIAAGGGLAAIGAYTPYGQKALNSLLFKRPDNAGSLAEYARLLGLTSIAPISRSQGQSDPKKGG